MTQTPPTFNQLNLVVRDTEASVAFYRRLGLDVEADADEMYVAVSFPNGRCSAAS